MIIRDTFFIKLERFVQIGIGWILNQSHYNWIQQNPLKPIDRFIELGNPSKSPQKSGEDSRNTMKLFHG